MSLEFAAGGCRKYWFRVPTTYNKESGVLSWVHKPEKVGPCPCRRKQDDPP